MNIDLLGGQEQLAEVAEEEQPGLGRRLSTSAALRQSAVTTFSAVSEWCGSDRSF
jgi:hypothetical protein